MQETVPDDLVAVGRISDAYGVQGMIKVIPFSEQHTILLDVNQWWLMRSDLKGNPLESMRDAKLVRSRPQGNAVVARLRGIADRDQAQALKGTTVYIARQDFPPEDEDEFYWVDLIGCSVYSMQTEPHTLIGIVREVSENGVHGVLHVQHQIQIAEQQWEAKVNAKGRPVESLIPFVKQIVPEVDLAKRYILADWPLDF
ncbi:ribosome maturation factor RimM [Pelistega sp. NLN82]|uniref:Ribosome maturation factor RimM n=1 Tax=Pelistega ratti TaxID=2652177 RepID=A0A6L9Y7P1_9BURK|nr:ribosome maturation factor RimM [Pelistega ratti]NEN76542.1 ribosome maturation factor RimM [Pelistega ratti]